MKTLWLIVFLPLFSRAQNTIGLPDVVNYTKQAYGAGLQNWDIKQDANGIMYFANNEGLLTFDGKGWRTYPLPNKTNVRSVEIAADSRIYVGGQNEIGYFSPAKNGQLKYHSLTEKIPEKYRSFGDVWDIVSLKSDVFFRLSGKIFKISGEKTVTFEPEAAWSFLGSCNGRIYARDSQKGMKYLSGDKWLQIPGELPLNDPVTAILSVKGRTWITTLKNGIFIVSDKGIKKHSSSDSPLFAKSRIYAAASVNKDLAALGSTNGGVFIVDSNAKVIQSFSRKEGLQNNHVLSIFLDNQTNLWLGLNNGIDVIAYNSAIKHINPLWQDRAGFTAIIHNNTLFAGTSNGLYSVPLQQIEDLSFSRGDFSQVQNSEGQAWNLSEIDDKLLLGHHEGAYIIRDNRAQKFSDSTGFWKFLSQGNKEMVAGSYRGLYLFDNGGRTPVLTSRIPQFGETSRFVVQDKFGNIWVSHPYHGLFKISKNKKGVYFTKTYAEKDGLPSTLNNYVYKIQGVPVVATGKGIFLYNYRLNKFEPSAYYKELLGEQSIRYIKEDKSGNNWFIHEKSLGVIDYSSGKPQVVYLPELDNTLLSGFEFIYPLNETNIFVGGEKGFFHINYKKYKKTLPVPKVQIRAVKIMDKTDSLLFGGYFRGVNEKQEQDEDQIPSINIKWKTIHFEFSSSLFQYQSNLEYSYRLLGFEKSWSEWSKRTDKEYTNLPAGRYSFEVKIKNNLQRVSDPVVYTFIVLPPWYLTVWAKTIYFLCCIYCLYLLYRRLKKKFELQRLKYEEEQNRLRYLHELERSKAEHELATLGHEKLEAEINFKNSELASSAMHLVQKAELIASIKCKLSQVIKELDNQEASVQIKGIIRALNEDDNLDKEWENFSKHFDKVQSGFLNELKERHPTITSNELKLCAYLRMNLSTKEIAQLANISIRGVEIGRYRLRKKLRLPAEVTLFDYLMSINPKNGGLETLAG